MANTDAPFGLNPVGKIGSGPPQKASSYSTLATYATAIFQGDMVKLNAGNVELFAAADAASIGVFWGANYDDSTGKPTFTNQKAASLATTVFVYDDPYQVFEVQGDGASQQSNLGAKADISATAGNTTNGSSKQELVVSSFASGSAINLTVVNFSSNPARGNVGDANLVYEVLINEHLYK